MRKILIAVLVLILTGMSAATAHEVVSGDAFVHHPDQYIGDADAALTLLQEGNLRFINANPSDKGGYEEKRAALQEGQHPFSVVLTCSDSRVVPEIYFDQDIGDIFTIRNAGNFVDSSVLGTIEYAVEHLNVRLVVVVGHSKCGAVTAAYAGGDYPDNIQSMLDRITPACESAVDLEDAIHSHIANMVALIQSNEIVREYGARVVAAHYAIEDGVVTWMVP